MVPGSLAGMSAMSQDPECAKNKAGVFKEQSPISKFVMRHTACVVFIPPLADQKAAAAVLQPAPLLSGSCYERKEPALGTGKVPIPKAASTQILPTSGSTVSCTGLESLMHRL